MREMPALFGKLIHMNVIKTELENCVIVEPLVHGDARGWFYETYSLAEFKKLGIDTVFVQDNRSFSAQKGTLRGLHCQTNPKAQTKLICCTRGAVLDVAVDIRVGSPSYLKWISVELTAENKRMLYIPKGFLHGFITLAADTEVFYKVDEFYSPENDRSVRFDDAQIGVKWGDLTSCVLSSKDVNAPLLCDSDVAFTF